MINKFSLLFLFGVIVALFPISQVKAQLTPDQTLHQENSLVNKINSNNNRIDGGAIRGANLFHSFQEFNIDQGKSVYFSNPTGIDNILTRVTGNNSSSILGKLGVLGNANFWLINPNGIYFSADASLDIKGSFIATTNNRVKLDENIYFGTKDLPDNKLLTIKPSAFFENALNNHLAKINNQGNLTVGANQNLMLFGGDVTNTGKLNAPGGSVFLLGENINLLDHATIDVSSSLGGGQVFIGGGFHGKGIISTAKTTYIGKDVNINADALPNPNSQQIANGGNVVIWSDQNTTFYGNISAKGVNNNLATVNNNYQNQNISQGGFVEVSSKQNLIFRGYVDTSAPSGQPGTLLIDPENITIAKGSGTDNQTTIYQNNLEALSGDNNLILEANNNITLEDLNNGILNLAAGQGKIAFIADADHNGIGNFAMTNTANTIKTNGRDIFIAGADLTLGNIDTSSISNSSTKTINIDNGGIIGEINNPKSANFTFTVTPDIGTTINTVSVRFSAAHTYVSDVTVFFTSPQGTQVTLFDGVGSDGQNFQDTLLSDNAIQNISEVQAPFPGTYKPNGILEIFSQENSTGQWTLEVIDNYIDSDSGQLYKTGETTTWGKNAIGTQLIFTTNLPTVAPSGVINLSATNGNIQAGNLNTNNSADSSMNAASLIRASGNIELNSYQGSSLHLWAGGSVKIDGDVNIAGVDKNHFIQETVNLSDPKTSVNINSNTQPTLDIRAGTTKFNFSNIFGFENNIIPEVSTGKNSAININGSISNSGGLVFLSNQYQPENSLNGNIIVNAISTNSDTNNGGSIFLDSNGEIDIKNKLNTFSKNNGGNISFFANDNINLKNSVNTQGLKGGNINLISHQNIFLNGININNQDPLFNFNLNSFGRIKSGDIQLIADKDINITSFNLLSDNAYGGGLSGNIILTSQGDIALKSSLITNTVDNGKQGEKGGDISINANSFIVSDQSVIQSKTFGNVNAGDVNIKAAETVNFSNDSKISTDTNNYLTPINQVDGNAGNINIIAQDVNFLNHSELTTRTYGTGNAGNIQINTNTLSFDKNSAILAENINAKGKGGDINIFADNLLLNNNSTFAANTNGTGNAGNIQITTTNFNIAAQGKLTVQSRGTGDAGNISITTKNLNVTDGIKISASTINSGKGGNIDINGNTLIANNGAQILTTTSGVAKAGNIKLKIRDNITLDGKNTGLFANTEKGSTGDSGSIDIDPQIFIIGNGAGIGVNSQGSGKGGNIYLQANSLTLDKNAFITAATASNQGGDINLQIQDLLWLRDSSNITATAGTAGAGGNGGNININSPFIIGFSNENSNITANAFEGNGGNINITTNSIFGLKFRPQETEFSDITASSQLGLNGNVQINTPDVDPTAGLVELPANLINAESLVGKTFCTIDNDRIAQGNAFTITGKGGLPANSEDLISNSPGIVEWANHSQKSEVISVVIRNRNNNKNQENNIKNPIIQQAQGWVISNDGKVILTAETVKATPQSSVLNQPNCHIAAEN